jgi:hypothetical protein
MSGSYGEFPTDELGRDRWEVDAGRVRVAQAGDQISVQYGDGGNGRIWKFGGVDKNMLK